MSLSASIGPIKGKVDGKPKENRENMETGLWFAGGLAAIGLGFYCLKECLKEPAREVGSWISKKVKRLFNGEEEEKSKPAEVEEQPEEPRVTTLNQTISQQSNLEGSNYLCGILRRGGVNLVGGATGCGKSFMGMQMAISLAGGERCGLVDEETPVSPIPVYYLDFELSDEDIIERYGDAGPIYPDLLRRMDVSGMPFADVLKVIEKISNEIIGEGCIIVDNISAFLSTQSGNDARSFFFGLKAIQKRLRQQEGKIITFVVFTHTIKNHGDECSLQTLAGSANVSNFADCVLAMGTTQQEDVKTLASLKNRSEKRRADIYLQQVKSPYLHFEFSGYKDEASTEGAVPAQSAPNQKVSSEMEEKMKDMRAQGMAQKEIAAQLGVSEKTVQRYLKKS